VSFFFFLFYDTVPTKKVMWKRAGLVFGGLVPVAAIVNYTVISETLNLTACCTFTLHKTVHK
jgi:hypothetical protein